MKYKKLEDYIVKCIETGVYKVGDAIESEEETCKKFNVSHLTVNKALTNLANAEYLKRVRGKRTYVNKKTVFEWRLQAVIKEITTIQE